MPRLTLIDAQRMDRLAFLRNNDFGPTTMPIEGLSDDAGAVASETFLRLPKRPHAIRLALSAPRSESRNEWVVWTSRFQSRLPDSVLKGVLASRPRATTIPGNRRAFLWETG